MFNTPINLSIFIYIIITFLVVLLKPKFFFTEEGEVIPFGCGKNETLFPKTGPDVRARKSSSS